MQKSIKKRTQRGSDSRKTSAAGYPEANPTNKEQANKQIPKNKKAVKQNPVK